MHLQSDESSAVTQTTAEACWAYWLNREQVAVKALQIDVHAFHDALGLMYR